MTTNNNLFEFEETDQKLTEWRGMPEFSQENKTAHRQILVSFEDDAGVQEFGKLINQSFTSKTKSIWFPERPINRVVDLFYFDSTDDQHPLDEEEE